MVQRQRELLVMGPNEQPLKREVDDDPYAIPDGQGRLKGHPTTSASTSVVAR